MTSHCAGTEQVREESESVKMERGEHQWRVMKDFSKDGRLRQEMLFCQQCTDESDKCILWVMSRDYRTEATQLLLLHQCFASCTGFLCGSASTLTSSRLFTGRCRVTSQVTWLTIAGSSPTPVPDDCLLLTREHWPSVAHRPPSATTTATLEQFAPWFVATRTVLCTI